MRDMQYMQGMNPSAGPGGAQTPPDATSLFKSEKEFLEIAEFEFSLNGVEERVLEMYGLLSKNVDDKKKKREDKVPLQDSVSDVKDNVEKAKSIASKSTNSKKKR